ncbi:hypothetical protein BYT27DRAFT_7207897 [Phlegmacium glaucopus]|nr:hypothetical protein BYT27DRAFT_7207897 [Phlegmacium glaucopus]
MRLIAVAAFLAVVDANVNLYHRVFHPSMSDLPYVHRASISFSPDSIPIVVPSPQLSDVLVSFSEMLESLQHTDGALYQLALQHEGDASNALWDLSSVKICHLDKASSETLILHLPNSQDKNPFALDYFVSPIPHDGSCREPHKSKKGPTPSISLRSFANNIQNLNSTILLRRSDLPPLPELHAPPPLTPEGEVVQPIPQKSFIQKYWLYIVALLLILLLGGGSEEEQPRRAQ